LVVVVGADACEVAEAGGSAEAECPQVVDLQPTPDPAARDGADAVALLQGRPNMGWDGAASIPDVDDAVTVNQDGLEDGVGGGGADGLNRDRPDVPDLADLSGLRPAPEERGAVNADVDDGGRP
jgi:hypothetical protein